MLVSVKEFLNYLLLFHQQRTLVNCFSSIYFNLHRLSRRSQNIFRQLPVWHWCIFCSWFIINHFYWLFGYKLMLTILNMCISYSFCFTKMLAHAVISFGICICIFLCFEIVLIPWCFLTNIPLWLGNFMKNNMKTYDFFLHLNLWYNKIRFFKIIFFNKGK